MILCRCCIYKVTPVLFHIQKKGLEELFCTHHTAPGLAFAWQQKHLPSELFCAIIT